MRRSKLDSRVSEQYRMTKLRYVTRLNLNLWKHDIILHTIQWVWLGVVLLSHSTIEAGVKNAVVVRSGSKGVFTGARRGER